MLHINFFLPSSHLQYDLMLQPQIGVYKESFYFILSVILIKSHVKHHFFSLKLLHSYIKARDDTSVGKKDFPTNQLGHYDKHLNAQINNIN